jgi:hypothetical protein
LIFRFNIFAFFGKLKPDQLHLAAGASVPPSSLDDVFGLTWLSKVNCDLEWLTTFESGDFLLSGVIYGERNWIPVIMLSFSDPLYTALGGYTLVVS